MVDVAPRASSLMHAPSDRERKYDRQLRLWATSGQAALECAHVLLINSGSGTVGIETLKNLVLPGIGSFTIADEAIVTDSDLGVNFFLDDSCRGKSRAQCCTKLLMELNPDVTGHYYPEPNSSLDLKALLDSPDSFTMIFYVLPLTVDQVDIVKAYAREHHIPVVAIYSKGFYSYFSISLPGIYPIIETHPEATANTDLRLLNPWPELIAFANDMTNNIDSLDDFEHGHLPLVVILLHYLSVWKGTHDSAYPTTYSDKVQFRSLISSAVRRNNAERGEENFEEAIAAVMNTVTPHSVPSALRQVFDYCDKIEAKHNPEFWIVARAVKQFFLRHDQLPLSGDLPDMKAKSSVYIELQKLYKKKARQDALEVFTTVLSIAGEENVTLADVELFCKNARFIKLIQANETEDVTAGIEQAIDTDKGLTKDKATALLDSEAPYSLIAVYLALAATAHIATATTKELMSSIFQRAPALIGNERVIQIAQEISRTTGGELHNISAITGGMVAQEGIKIITKQYIPIENTCVFDGIESRCEIFRL